MKKNNMDIISIVLSAISIAQNISLSENRKEKINSLIAAYELLNKIYSYLDDAKIVHDEMQRFHSVCHDHFITFNEHQYRNSTLEKLNTEKKSFYRNFIIVIQTLTIDFEIINRESLNTNIEDKLLRNSLSVIISTNPKFILSIERIRKNISKLEEKKNESFNEDVRSLIVECEHIVEETLQHADTIILHTVPVLGIIQNRMYEGIKTL